jgi:hypothetical protein
MKTARSVIRLCIVLLTLILLTALLAVSVLAKGIARVKGNAMLPEKLDVRPVPVPAPPSSAMNKPQALVTPSPSSAVASVPQPVPVPTPPASAQTDLLPAQNSTSQAPALSMVAFVRSRGMIVLAVLFVVLILIWRQYTVSSHSLHQECAG